MQVASEQGTSMLVYVLDGNGNKLFALRCCTVDSCRIALQDAVKPIII